MKRRLVLLLMVACFPLLLHAEQEVKITGTVTYQGGKPAGSATISVEPGQITVQTDEQGNYSLVLAEGTYSIIVEAPGGEVRGETLILGERDHLDLDFVLQPKVLQFEEIVLASRETDSSVSISSPSSSVKPANQIRSSSVLASLADIPGVAPLGQGGLFQVPSVRGAARERTILMLDSVRVTSERRTGASFSFVDPLFLERINVTRGPAPVLYGSNGETGLIQAGILEPAITDLATKFRTGYQSNSDENWQALSIKKGTDRFQFVLGAARRGSGDFEAGDGQKYPSGYDRVNLLGKLRWITDAGALTFTAMPTWTRDIEKASSDALTRPTLYPEEDHQVYMVDWQNPFLQGSYDYQIQGWLHPSSLITQDERVTNGTTTSRNLVYNETDDFGIRFRVGRAFFQTWRFWTGIDYFGRANVNARQESFVATSNGFGLTDSFFSIKDGSYNDVGLFVTGNGNLGKAIVNTGLRLQRVSVGNKAGEEASNSENSWSGNVGLSYPFTSNWEGVFNLGRGIRPATISEKFFTGETGRGSITGNPDLATESNVEVDGGIRFRRGAGFAGLYVFRNKIDQFIARVNVDGDRFTYLNLPGVSIYGVEGEGFYRWRSFGLYGNFHVIQGHDAADADINDIPPSRLMAGVEFEPQESRWMGSVEFVRQFKKADPGPDELIRDSAVVINAQVQFEINEIFKVRAAGSNLTNETYFDSADNRAPLAIGRSLSVELLTEF